MSDLDTLRTAALKHAVEATLSHLHDTPIRAYLLNLFQADLEEMDLRRETPAALTQLWTQPEEQPANPRRLKGEIVPESGESLDRALCEVKAREWKKTFMRRKREGRK